jgi:hypothetical protein
MHSHLNQLMAQEHIADLYATAERSRLAAGDRLELEDGRRLRVRPIEPEDRHRFRDRFARLTPTPTTTQHERSHPCPSSTSR